MTLPIQQTDKVKKKGQGHTLSEKNSQYPKAK